MASKYTQPPRVHVTLGDSMSERLDEVQALTGIPTRPETARYVMARGFEGLATALANQRLVQRIGDEFTSEEAMRLLASQLTPDAIEKEAGQDPHEPQTEAKKRPKGSP